MTPPHTRQLHSTVHQDSTVTLALVEADLPAPGPDDVVVRIEARPSIRPIWVSCSPVPR